MKFGLDQHLEEGQGSALSVCIGCAHMHTCVMTYMIMKPDGADSQMQHAL